MVTYREKGDSPGQKKILEAKFRQEKRIQLKMNSLKMALQQGILSRRTGKWGRVYFSLGERRWILEEESMRLSSRPTFISLAKELSMKFSPGTTLRLE